MGHYQTAVSKPQVFPSRLEQLGDEGRMSVFRISSRLDFSRYRVSETWDLLLALHVTVIGGPPFSHKDPLRTTLPRTRLVHENYLLGDSSIDRMCLSDSERVSSPLILGGEVRPKVSGHFCSLENVNTSLSKVYFGSRVQFPTEYFGAPSTYCPFFLSFQSHFLPFIHDYPLPLFPITLQIKFLTGVGSGFYTRTWT